MAMIEGEYGRLPFFFFLKTQLANMSRGGMQIIAIT